MHIYVQENGNWYDPDLHLLGPGYAGKGVWRNNPYRQDVHMLGPLPTGVYRIGKPVDHPEEAPELGKYVMKLVPDPGNNMFGRSGFYCHGENPAHFGESSDGCVVMDAVSRVKIGQWVAKGNDKVEVVARMADLEGKFGTV